ncbi:PPK2 family polyphosphate kinase [Actinokineospora sp. UTMC 2448]|uniref:PPK2 family polyphosphate kinase n=1 Tax=Actinokineospora sp. UTMC 2448 TaxID=2268449 RepID=UPI0021642F77|nr:PPK2 family polyphosphate kinase [Actinokineospora sp. UTMC 2448]UVS78069.1 polyphosphate:nucleotide phosphotransferase, PPK2 family [Actinokineospora sp. UTMC 2448]
MVRDVLRVRPGDLPDPRSTPVGPTSKQAARAALPAIGARLAELQEALYAEATRGVLLVLQGMDTSGKGGTIKHVAGLLNPLGLRIASFKSPTREERRHDFLWRIRKQVPVPGQIGVFDRSHYEDVLIVRVENLAPDWEARYSTINAFEAELADSGITVIKCFLHISPREQKKRLLDRLNDPSKHWKYNPADLAARAKWSAYQEAYAAVLARCSTPAAPWYVIPADRKWYRNWAVASLLLETLEALAPQPPRADFDVRSELTRLTEHDPLA